MQNKVFSALNYVGHKSKIIEQINSNLPKQVDGLFWDMFSGSCVVGLSVDFTKVNFVDNNLHLQNLMKNLSNKKFVERVEEILSTYGFTNSSRKPRSEYLKDPKIGTCTWHGKKVKNMHLDALNKESYSKLIKDYNSDLFKKLDKACCYYILTIYGRNSNVGVDKNNNLVGGIGPLDFGPRAKSKVLRYQEVLSKKEVNFYHAEYSNFLPEKDDFVYLDPPYLASNFKYGFWDESSEKKLLNWIDNLDCKWALSNSFQSGKRKNEILIDWSKKYNTVLIDKKYRGWAAKGKENTKKKVNVEVLIKNY